MEANDLVQLFHINELAYCNRQLIYYSEEFYSIVVIKRCDGTGTVIPIPEKYRNVEVPFRIAVVWKNLIILPPFQAREYCIYDPERKEFSSIPFPEDCYMKDEVYGIYGSCATDDHIFFYGRHPVIIRLDMNNKETVFSRSWLDSCREQIDRPVKTCAFSRKPFFYNNRIYVLCIEHGFFLGFSTDLNDFSIINIPDKEKYSCLTDIAVGDGKYWMTDINENEDNRLVCWDIEGQGVEEILIPREDGDGKTRPYLYGETHDGELYILPAWSGYCRKYSPKSRHWEKIEIPHLQSLDTENEVVWTLNYFSGHKEDDHIITVFQYGPSVVEFNMGDGTYKNVPITFDDNQMTVIEGIINDRIDRFINKGEIINEDRIPGGIRSFMNKMLKDQL